MQNMPNTLPIPGGEINRAGAGSSITSGTPYKNLLTGKVIAVYDARLLDFRSRFARAEVVGHSVLRSVKLELRVLWHSRITQIGQRLLIGDVSWLPEGPAAALAWPVFRSARRAGPSVRTRIDRDGHVFVRAGKPGPLNYFVDTATGERIAARLATVINTGKHYDIVAVARNPELAEVRIDKNGHRLAVGDAVLVTDIAKLSNGPRAAAWWMATER